MQWYFTRQVLTQNVLRSLAQNETINIVPFPNLFDLSLEDKITFLWDWFSLQDSIIRL